MSHRVSASTEKNSVGFSNSIAKVSGHAKGISLKYQVSSSCWRQWCDL